jgi:hypothetical protein
MTSPFPSDSPELRALLTEKFQALLDECNLVMECAAHGRTLHDLDDFFCTKGQNFMQEVFQKKLQDRVGQIEATNETRECGNCKKNASPRHPRKRHRRYSRTHHPHPSTPPLPSLQEPIHSRRRNYWNRRWLKQTGACWRVERANKIAFISSVLYSQQWKYCWKNSH